MKIPDDFRQAVAGVTEQFVEQGKLIGREAQIQVNLKKFQVEQARVLHSLGKKTYEWYRSGALVVSGAVPDDVAELCRQAGEFQKQIDAAEAEIGEIREAARKVSTPAAVTAEVDPPQPGDKVWEGLPPDLSGRGGDPRGPGGDAPS